MPSKEEYMLDDGKSMFRFEVGFPLGAPGVGKFVEECMRYAYQLEKLSIHGVRILFVSKRRPNPTALFQCKGQGIGSLSFVQEQAVASADTERDSVGKDFVVTLENAWPLVFRPRLIRNAIRERERLSMSAVIIAKISNFPDLLRKSDPEPEA
jgi:hypothetical protein